MRTMLEQVADLNFIQTLVTIFFTTWLTFLLSNWRTSKLEKKLVDEMRLSRDEMKYIANEMQQLILNVSQQQRK